ncbi:MAG: BrnA antitoxin family protein, partial [Methylocystis sp.]|nr:BrnA antitoxin family protein [Methylocystis sp.]
MRSSGCWRRIIRRSRPRRERCSKRQGFLHLRLDSDIVERFRARGKGHLTHMNAVLRAYVDAQKGRG